VRFELPRGLRLRPGALRGHAGARADGRPVDAGRITALSSRVVQVRGLGARGADRVHLRLRHGALEVSSSLRRRAHHLEISRIRRLHPLKLPAVVRTGRHDGRRTKLGLKVTGRA
jgi:hypothetical protein